MISQVNRFIIFNKKKDCNVFKFLTFSTAFFIPLKRILRTFWLFHLIRMLIRILYIEGHDLSQQYI